MSLVKHKDDLIENIGDSNLRVRKIMCASDCIDNNKKVKDKYELVHFVHSRVKALQSGERSYLLNNNEVGYISPIELAMNEVYYNLEPRSEITYMYASSHSTSASDQSADAFDQSAKINPYDSSHIRALQDIQTKYSETGSYDGACDESSSGRNSEEIYQNERDAEDTIEEDIINEQGDKILEDEPKETESEESEEES